MTTVAINPENSSEVAEQPDTDAASGGVVSAETTLEPSSSLVVGEIVSGPIRLNTGEDVQLPPFRAGNLDPRHLRDSPLHPRQELGDLAELVASISMFGVRDPLVVVGRPAPVNELPAEPTAAADGDEADEPVTEIFEVLGGKRRHYAAIEAGQTRVPCIIVDDAGAAFEILAILEANAHRKDLEAIEEAGAYQMLLDLDWDVDAIAQARNIAVEHVTTAVKALSLPSRAQRALNSGTLTLDMAQGLEEFADSPEDQQRLLDKIGKGEYEFKHTLSSLRDKRQYGRSRDLAKAQLLIDGVDVTPKPRGFGYEGTAVAADRLVDADNQPLDVEKVKTLPGWHAFVEKNGGQARTVIYCEDPAKFGYHRQEADKHEGMSAEEIAEQQEKDRRREEMLDGLRAAVSVRHEFVQRTYGTAKNCRKLATAALRAANNGHSMYRGGGLEDLYRALGGLTSAEIATAGEDRLRRSLIAKYVCSQENNLDDALRRNLSWVSKEPAVAWFDRLTADGYPMSEAEKELYQALLPATAADEDEDEDDSDENDADVTTADEPDADADADDIGGDGEIEGEASPAVSDDGPQAPDPVAARFTVLDTEQDDDAEYATAA
ncbi:ParB/RepB/Spo0J family partition protein [Actinoplanes sp. GCM10030250]|uniref:ParB/RepB/Spo0J family partition protein n=1 Tax=Actinoplanes sp. GCM10030250 TaxID=3273376 RepID=UPI003612DD24